MADPQAFPLHWPEGYQRTVSSYRKRAQFKATFGAGIAQVINELRLLGATYPVISTNQPLRRDGLPAASKSYIHDPGVAVYFLWKGKQRVFACDKWDKIEDNVRAIAKTIEAMRGMERWGVSQAMERSFAGFTALPEPERDSSGHIIWWAVLNVSRSASLSEIEESYRKLAREHHPDSAPNEEARKLRHKKMVQLNQAITEARQEKRGAA